MDVSDYYYEGSIPFITRTDSNNGCNGYVQKDMVEDTEKGNALIRQHVFIKKMILLLVAIL